MLPSLPTLTKYFIFHSVSAFSFYLKKKTPAKEKQTQGFAPRPRERRAAVHSLLFSVGSSAHSPVNSLRSNSTVSCGLLCKPSPRSSQIACSTAARLLEACSSKFIKSLTLPCGKCPYSLFFVFCVFRKATSCRINLGRIIFAFTRFNIRHPLYFCGRTKLTPTVYHLKCLCKSLLVKLFNHLTRLQCIQKVPTGTKLSGLNLFYGHSAFPERLKLTFRLWINTFRRRPVQP